jgi:phosphatidate cytidylyltransferase
MLAKRLKVIALLLPVGLLLIFLGGWLYSILILLILVIAGWEYHKIFNRTHFSPSLAILISSIILLALSRWLFNFLYYDVILTICIFLAITRHIISYEMGQENAAIDFAITLSGILYIGWLGSYFISIRNLPDGTWWLLLTLSAIWFADAAAYFTGRRFGRHPLTKRVSPSKTWEGYLGGIFFSILLTPLLAMLWHTFTASISAVHGLVLGGVISVFAPLGDLAESLFKRQFGVKDSGTLLPGHGGIFDRIDSWLWAVAIGYYIIYGIFLNT